AVVPHMKLLQVQALYPQIPETSFRVVDNVRCRVTIFQLVIGSCRPFEILRRYLGGAIQIFPGVTLQQFAQQIFALAISVGPRGVKEIASQRHRPVERLPYLIQVGSCPASHSPHTISYFTYLPIGSSESSVLHLRRWNFLNVTGVSRSNNS